MFYFYNVIFFWIEALFDLPKYLSKMPSQIVENTRSKNAWFYNME